MNILIEFVNNIFILLGIDQDRQRATLYAKRIGAVLKTTKLELQVIEDYVLENHTNYKYPSIKLFLDAFGYKSKASVYDEIAQTALDNIINKIGYMSDTKIYTSEDKYLLTTINLMGGVKSIQSSYVKADSNFKPVISPYFLKAFNEKFKTTYINVIKNNIKTVKEIGRDDRKMMQIEAVINIPYKVVTAKQLQSNNTKLIGV